MKTDLVTQNVAMKVDRPKKNDYQPVFLDAEELQHLFEVVKGTKLSSAKAMVSGMALPESVNFGSKWSEISNDGGKN